MSYHNLIIYIYLILHCSSICSQDIMSYRKYQKIDHEEPYIYQIKTEEGSLFYFGSHHSFNPSDPQFDTLLRALKRFKPDIILSEAHPEKFDYLLYPEANG